MQRVDQGTRAPQEHAAVPEEIPGTDELRSPLRIGFFGEAAHTRRLTANGRAALNISVASFRARRPDA